MQYTKVATYQFLSEFYVYPIISYRVKREYSFYSTVPT